MSKYGHDRLKLNRNGQRHFILFAAEQEGEEVENSGNTGGAEYDGEETLQ